MGDISIIARRLEGGTRVQFGWSGNGGYFSAVGSRLLRWYNDPKQVEYLFGLGQMRAIGVPGSENGGESRFLSNQPDGQPHWLGRSEREIFSKICFTDYGYFYDLDNTWYYVKPGPFCIKIPLVYIVHHLDDSYMEFDELHRISVKLLQYILGEYRESDPDFQKFLADNFSKSPEEILKDILSSNYLFYRFSQHYDRIRDYLDNWVVVKTKEDMSDITGFVLKRRNDEERVETINWQ